MFALPRLRHLVIKSAMVLFVVFSINGCTPAIDDYAGTWVGLDERNPEHSSVYEYQIAEAGDNQLSVRVIKKSYEYSQTSDVYVWTESAPKYFPALYSPNEGGAISTPFGILKYDVATGGLDYNNIRFVKKAKNTELKLKYVARKHISDSKPEAHFVD